MMLGRLLERSEHTAESVTRIETRLELGERQFQEHASRLSKLEAGGNEESRVERKVKLWLAYLLPAGALYVTESWQIAVEILKTLIMK